MKIRGFAESVGHEVWPETANIMKRGTNTMKNKITIQRVFKHGEYEIMKCFDRFGNWNYTLMYKGNFRIQSFDFNRLKTIALNDAPYLAN